VETGEAVIVGGIKRDEEFMRQHDPKVDLAGFEAAWAKRTSGDAAGPSYEPNYEGSSVVLGPPGASIGVDGSHTFAARAGHHLAPEVLASGRNVYEELGTGFTLLAFDADEAELERFRAAAAALGIPLDIVADSYRDGRLEYQARMVLVRPDQYVAWAADAIPDDTGRLLRQVTGRA
jgi:4-hydroxyisophthalate hydroxylase